MKERPILFQGAMARALLDGMKTQTRRAFSTKMIETMGYASRAGEVSYFIDQGFMEPNDSSYVLDFCPYGQPGDRLWVRESFMDLTNTGVEHHDSAGKRQRYAYMADSPAGSYGDEARKGYGLKWKPSIHMPRVACRILLEIVSVRVERLNDISDADAHAEGCPCYVCGTAMSGTSEADCHCFHRTATAFDYCNLWESINGVGSWAANPWVWCLTFRRILP